MGREEQQQAKAAEKVAAKQARDMHSELSRDACNTKTARNYAAAKKRKAESITAKRRRDETQRKREDYTKRAADAQQVAEAEKK
eukprot:3423430-Pleurochrysis_carterae.AAC.1